MVRNPFQLTLLNVWSYALYNSIFLIGLQLFLHNGF